MATYNLLIENGEDILLQTSYPNYQSLLIDGVKVDRAGSYEFRDITTNHIFTITCSPDPFSVQTQIKYTNPNTIILELAEGIVCVDGVTAKSIWSLLESISTSEVLFATTYISVQDVCSFVETLGLKWDAIRGVSENLLMLDFPSFLRQLSESLDDGLDLQELLSANITAAVFEALLIRDTLNGYASYNKEVSDLINIVDSVVIKYLGSLTESLETLDNVTVNFPVLVNDFVNLVETLNPYISTSPSIAETINVVDSVLGTWLINLVDTFDLGESISSKSYIAVSELLSLSSTISLNTNSFPSIAEGLNLIDSVLSNWLINLLDSVSIEDAADVLRLIQDELSESLSIIDTLNGIGYFNLSAEESISLDDQIFLLRNLALDESISITDTIALIGVLTATITDTILLESAVDASQKYYLLLSEALSAVDDLTAQSKFNVFIEELLRLDIHISFNNEIYECFVLNTSQFHPSVYTGFSFNSYCSFRNRAFGANEQGIFELTGDTDNSAEFQTGILFHDTDFSMPQKKKIRKAYLGVEGNKPIMVMESGGTRKAYKIDDKGMVDASRAVKGKAWTLSVVDFQEIESIKLVPVILARGN